ncbi:hypothetical protein GQ457_04G019020 [Hibiscus cannabinus]
MRKVAPIPAYTWTFEPVVSSREGTSMCRKDKAAGYFAAHMAFPAGIVPHVKGIFPYSFRAQNHRTPL